VTEPGGTRNPAGGSERPGEGSTGETPPGELPRWQPFADTPPSTPPSALPDESTLTPAPSEDQGTIIPDQLPDAPAYVPPPVGMTPGGVMPPQNPADVPSSAWITTAPQAPAKRGIGANLGGIIGAIVGIVIVGLVVANALDLLPSNKGKILFGTAAGSDLCSVNNETKTIKTTDPVFFAAVLKHHMDGAQAITFKIVKDGKEFVSHDEPADGTSFDCYGNRDSLGTLEAGTYTFQVLHKTDVEATGTLVVSP
jgi:hypothetical protein